MNNLELLPNIGVFGQQITSSVFAQEDGSADTCILSKSISSAELDNCIDDAVVNVRDFLESIPPEESGQISDIINIVTDIDELPESLSKIKSAFGEDILSNDQFIEWLIDIFKCTSVECPVNCDEPPTDLQQQHIKAFEDTRFQMSNCDFPQASFCELFPEFIEADLNPSEENSALTSRALFPAAILALTSRFLSI